MGKPAPQLFLTALDRLGEGRTLVIGDRLDSDVAAAAAAGLDAALVHSGVGTGESPGEPGDEGRGVPVAEAATLAELVLALLTVARRTRHVEVAMREHGWTTS